MCDGTRKKYKTKRSRELSKTLWEGISQSQKVRMPALPRYISAHQTPQTDQTKTLPPQRHTGTSIAQGHICLPAATTDKGTNPTNARHKGTPVCMMLKVPTLDQPPTGHRGGGGGRLKHYSILPVGTILQEISSVSTFTHLNCNSHEHDAKFLNSIQS